jgi:glycosyltransferase 2 family protein
VHWSAVRTALGGANLFLIALAVVCFVATIFCRAVRWRLLLGPEPRLRLGNLFGCLNVAYLINNLLPFQMGDLGRSYLLAELEGISATRTASTVLVERVLDVLTLLLILAGLAPFVAIPAWAQAPAITLAVLFSCLAFVLIAASRRRSIALRLAERFLRLAPVSTRPKLREMIENALDGVAALGRPGPAARLLAFSAATWLAVGFVLLLGMKALAVDTGYDAALFVMVATTFGIFVPASPGAFGVYHAIAIGVLTGVFGVDKSIAVSYALVIHLVIYLPPVLIGSIFLWLRRDAWQSASLLRKLRELRGEMRVVPGA